jgi:hypothetical protein
MQLHLHQAPRCGAKTRRGDFCRAPAMINGRCRMHGGKSTGAPKGNQNALKHGRYTAEALAECKSVGELLRVVREALSALDAQSSTVEAMMMAKQKDAAPSNDDELPFGREEKARSPRDARCGSGL